MQSLLLAENLFAKVADHSKTSTIRYGRREIVPGDLELVSSSNPSHKTIVRVDHVYYKTWSQLGMDEVRCEGYRDLASLHTELRRFYPDARDDDEMTVIVFKSLA